LFGVPYLFDINSRSRIMWMCSRSARRSQRWHCPEISWNPLKTLKLRKMFLKAWSPWSL